MVARSLEARLRFVNRHAELSILGSLLSTSGKNSKLARVSIIHGRGGVGKTQLVRHAVATVAHYDVSSERNCTPEEAHTPFSALSGLVANLSANAAERGLPTFESFLRSGQSAFLLANHREEVLDRILLIIPKVGDLASTYSQRIRTAGAFAPQRYLNLDPVGVVLSEYVEHLLEQADVLLFLDDAHFADPHSLATLANLATTSDARLALILTFRTNGEEALERFDRLSAKFRGATAFVPIEVSPLARQDFGLLVRDALGSAHQDALIDHYYDLTQGNLRGLIDEVHYAENRPGALPRRENHLVQDERERAVLSARISELPRGLRQLLTIIAVHGQPMGPTLLGRVLDCDAVGEGFVLREQLEVLVAKDLLRFIDYSPGVEAMQVAHPRVRDVILATDDSYALHAHGVWGRYFARLLVGKKFSEFSERDVLYRLILHHARAAPDSAAPLLRRALDVALQFDDLASAAAFALDCAAAVTSVPARTKLTVEAARFLFGIGKFEEADRVLGLPHVPRPSSRDAAAAQVLRVMIRERLDHAEAAQEAVELMGGILEGRHAEPRFRELALAAAIVGMTGFTSNRDYTSATRLFEWARIEFEDLAETPIFAVMLRNSEQVLEIEHSLDPIRTSIATFLRAGDRRGAACAQVSLAMQLIRLGSLDEAWRELAIAETTLRELGSYDLEIPWNNQAVILLLRGDPDGAATILRRAVLLADYRFSEVVVKVNLATALRQSGRVREARALCHAVAEMILVHPDRALVFEAGYQTARNLLAIGETAAAEAIFEATRDAIEPWWDYPYWIAWLDHELHPDRVDPPVPPERLSYLFDGRFDAYPVLSFWHFDPPP